MILPWLRFATPRDEAFARSAWKWRGYLLHQLSYSSTFYALKAGGGGSMHSPVLLLFVLQYSISHLFYISYLKTLAEYWGNKWVNAQSSVHAAKVNFPQQKGREVYAWKWLLLFSMWSHLQASTWVGMRGWSHVFIKIGFFFAFALGTYLRVCECVWANIQECKADIFLCCANAGAIATLKRKSN